MRMIVSFSATPGPLDFARFHRVCVLGSAMRYEEGNKGRDLRRINFL